MNTNRTLLLIMAALLVGAPLMASISVVRGANVSKTMYQGTSCPGTALTLCFGDGQTVNPTITVNQGDSVNITVHNNDTTSHTFTLSGAYSTQSITNTPGQTQSLVFTANTATAGVQYSCTIAGHSAAGMRGTFVVNAQAAPISPFAVIGLLLTAGTAVYLLGRRRQ